MKTLRHIHLQLPRPGAFPTYAFAVRVQEALQQRLLDYKASRGASASASSPPPPPPTLVSFTPAPTYTLGRRQTEPLGQADRARMTRPLEVAGPDDDGRRRRLVFAPSVHHAPRGGLATYHGPGQLVLWPVIDLHAPHHRHFTVRDYACLLEKTTIAALARTTAGDESGGGPPPVQGHTTTENPGVWVRHRRVRRWEDQGGGRPGAFRDVEPTDEERKIAALGVHLRRHVTGLGVAVNCDVAVDGPEDRNPWSRIVACGLEDKRVTSVLAEMGQPPQPPPPPPPQYVGPLAENWSHLFAQRLFGDDEYTIEKVDAKAALGLDVEEEGAWAAGAILE